MSSAPRNNNWKWFFAIVIGLALFVAVSLIWWNLRLQLKPEELEAARKLWDEKGPASYSLDYTETFTGEGDSRVLSNRYVVQVRDRKVTEMVVNGIREDERREYHDMNGLFNEIEVFQDKDEKEKRRIYRRAIFDPNHGAILWYVRRVMNSRERQEITVKSLEVK